MTRHAARLAVRALLITALAVVLLLLGAFVVVPRLAGWVSLTVLTGSMRPSLPPGSQIVVSRIENTAEIADIRIGDVITFLPKPADPTLVTHRVIEVHQRGDGTRSFRTKGDANPSPDPELIGAEQIRGKLLYHLPLVGYLGNGLSGQVKRPVLIVLGLGLLGYSIVTLASVIRNRARRPFDSGAGRRRHRAGP